MSLKRPLRVGPQRGFSVGREKKAKECLELPVGLTQLNITARWWRAGEMEMHTNRLAPSVQPRPVHTRRDSVPDGPSV